MIDLVMSIGGYNVKIAGTSRGCKANSIEERASGQERVDRYDRVRVGNGMCIVLCMNGYRCGSTDV